ncbi:MAG: hypothetical protein ACREBB_06150 [Nitrosotalea sp.]
MSQKITIFTGSGASYGCGLVTPYNPPLGKDLYSRLEVYAPQIMSQVSAIVGRNNIDNFEMKMYEIMQSNRVNAAVLNSMIAAYFSQFSPNMFGNSYVELFRILKMKNDNFVYSTLNYDCLAELAASSLGIQVNYNPNTQSGQLDVLKLHGSCNFLLGGMTGPLGGLSMPIGGAMIDGPIEVVQPAQVHTIIQNRPAGPCMCFYMKDKPTPVGASTIKAIQQRWEKRILESDKIIIIGVNVNKEDRHVWDPISKTKAKIGFVGSSTAYSNLKSLNTNLDTTHIAMDFGSSVTSITQFI